MTRLLLALTAVVVVGCGQTMNTTDGGSGGGTSGTGGGTSGTGGGTSGTGGGSTAGGSTAGGSTAGGSTAGGSTAGGSTAGGSAGGGTAAPCAAYCTSIMTTCTGSNAQFTSQASCEGTCSAWMAGTAGATSGNTLACRGYHLGVAATGTAAAATHCPHAGPGGGGACGANCEGFCTVAQAKCAGQFADNTACMTACSGFTNATAMYTSMGNGSGNTFACRLYHLTVAATDTASATTHCPHIPASSPPCQ